MAVLYLQLILAVSTFLRKATARGKQRLTHALPLHSTCCFIEKVLTAKMSCSYESALSFITVVGLATAGEGMGAGQTHN